MFWKILDRAVQLLFLLLAVTILADRYTAYSNTAEFDAFRKEVMGTISNNLRYAEGRINKLQETSDKYQVTSSRKIYLIENRLEVLEKENKALKLQSKNIVNNINTNNNVINGRETDSNNNK